MRKTLLMLGMFYSFTLIGQVGINTVDPKVTLDVVGKVNDGTRPEGFIAPRLTGDALFAASGNLQYGIEQDGAIVYVTEPASGGNTIGQTTDVTSPGYYYFDAPADKWKKIGNDSNIFNSDGTLTDRRVVDMNNNTLGMVNGKLSVGSDIAHPSSSLQIDSGTGGFLPPRMTRSQMEAIVDPALALMVYCTDCFAGSNGCLMINDSSDGTTPRWGSLCSSNMPVPDIESLDCNSYSFTGTLYEGKEAHDVTASISYINGNGASYAQSSFVRNGLTFLLPAGTLANGNGTLSYKISGTPIAAGRMVVWLSFAGNSSCGIYVDVLPRGTVLLPGNEQPWMQHNLGADVDLDPDIPVQGISGHYYQWGKLENVATDGTDPAPIVGWNTTNAPTDAWLDEKKTANDPCPAGFRVPTRQQMIDMVSNTDHTALGTFENSPSNFGSAQVFSSGSNKMTLPTSGNRRYHDGSLTLRGGYGYYWSSSFVDGEKFYSLRLTKFVVGVPYVTNSNYGYSVRCIRE